jgi:hypothetical protein
MSNETERAPARCEGCGKGYRVPGTKRTYTCKACGGTVRATQRETAPDLLAGRVTCSGCQAVNPVGSHFCAECGAGIGAAAASRSDRSLKARRQASSQLNRAFKRIKAIRWLYRLGAVGYALTTVVTILAMGSVDMPVGGGLLLIALFTGLTVFMVVGAIQIRFQPFVWTVIVASLSTVTVAVALFQAGPISFQFVWGGMWATLFWLAVIPTVRFRKLIEEHPDLYIVHRIHGTQLERAHDHRSRESSQERSRRILGEAGRRAWRLSAAVAGGIGLASLLGTTAVYAKLRPEEFTAREELFRDAWNSASPTGIEDLYADRVRKRDAGWIAEVALGNGWHDAWPEIGDPVIQRSNDTNVVVYPLGERAVVTEWRLADGEWLLFEITAPLPSLEPTFERFVAAWETSDVEAIAQLFAPKSRAKLERSIHRSIERREWDEFPAILSWESESVSNKRVDVPMDVRGGVVTTRWRFGADGHWALESLKLPRR